MWEGITKNASMAQYTHVQALQLPQRSCRKLGLIEVAMMVMRIEIKTIEFWRAVISECLGTFLYVLLGCTAMLYCDEGHSAFPGRLLATSSGGQRAAGAAASGSPDADHRSGDHRVTATGVGRGDYLGDGTETAQVHLIIALSFGLIMATLVQCFGHISGAHFNPVTTMAMALTCKITPLRGFFYAIAQLGGGIAGAALLYGIVPETCRQDLGVTQVHPHLSKGQACGIELILTFILIFTIFATIDPNRKELGSKPLAIGLTVSMCHLVGYRYTSSSLNPARSLGPAFVTNRWSSHWIYWVGPFGGGITAGLLYEYIFDPSRRRKPPQAPPSVELEEDTPGEQHAMTPRRVAGHFYPFDGTRRSVHGYMPAVPIDTGLENQAYAYDSHPRRYMPSRFASKREPSQQILLNDSMKTSSSDSFYNRPV